MQFRRKGELFLSARDHGINYLIYGNKDQVDLAQELLPAVDESKKTIYFASKRKYIHNLRSCLLPGEGDALAFPASSPSDLCGVFMKNGNIRWFALHKDARTLCYYESARQPYPNGMICLDSLVGVHVDF